MKACGGIGFKTNWRNIRESALMIRLGWSEPADAPRDPVTFVEELHALLEVAGVPPPYIMAGHSYGAILARVDTMQYPQEVMGLVLVDICRWTCRTGDWAFLP